MWNIAIVLVAALIIAVEWPVLRQARTKREIAVFIVLLGCGTGGSIAQAMQIEILNPLDVIAVIYKPMNEAIFALLK
ncbi:hypothetical protein SAMN02799630_03563 [Paenibacillus sp. UNCCL117]|uniref:hypothetical protein n=1 Tax=unclassified Paenibacillus TaxID=185978 RepID=UPI00088347B5|nr:MULTISPECIES: hypothetical protein [unclassified Paenibacillus]SDD39231.1 hypothetical protein SAMN04488602_10856 [Paenibacillus sp. cl123]SFW48413.1 hypothetical protein SAMN02799630_03563 [Paenibacillus sp. UNCCL117]